MKGMKGKLLKKLKSINSIGHSKPVRVLHLNASDGFVDALPRKSNVTVQTQMVCKEEEPKVVKQSSVTMQEPEIIDVSELMRDLEDDEMDFDFYVDNKENIRPETQVKNPVVSTGISSSLKPRNGKPEAPKLQQSRNGDSKHAPLSEIKVSTFRQLDLNSGCLFEPNLSAAFDQVVMVVKTQEAEKSAIIEELNPENIEEEPPLKAQKFEENRDPLLDFEENCPPGGADSIVLYTSGLRGIRKTFEDCESVRILLKSFGILFYERDVSMHSEFREELWRTLGGKVVPPRLFIKGRYIGGAEQVLELHEQGKLRPLFKGVPVDRSDGPCEGCAGIRFVMCFRCSGSHKVVSNDAGSSEKCPECNENGLIICPICC